MVTNARAMNSRLSFALLCVTFFLMLLDFSIVNVALPSMETDLHAAASTMQWVISTYAIALAGFEILGGRLSDLYGRRRLFTIGLAAFTVASCGAGLAPNIAVLIGMRALQGLGAAIVTPCALAIVASLYSGEERNRAIGWWNTIGTAGIAVGMLVGGALVQFAGWRAIFFVNVPVAIVILGVISRILPADVPASQRSKLDLIGAALLSGGLVLLVYTIESLADRVAGPDTWMSLAIAAALLGGFVTSELRSHSPLVPLRMFGYPALLVGCAVVLAQGGAYAAAMIFGASFAQQVNHFSPLLTGMAFMPSALATTVIAGPLTAPMMRRVGARATCVLGGATMVAGLACLMAMQPATPYWAGLLPGTVLLAFGGMLAYQVGVISALARVDPADSGMASGMLSSTLQVGMSIGVASAAAASVAFGFTAAFAVGVVLAALTLALAFAVRSVAPASVPRRAHAPLGRHIHTLRG